MYCGYNIIIEVTVLLLTCSYREHEFIRIGYYVNNEMELTPEQQQAIDKYAEECNQQNIPIDNNKINEIRGPILIEKVWRNILTDKPRVTRFNIPWDSTDEIDNKLLLTAEEKKQLESTTGIDGNNDEFIVADNNNNNEQDNDHDNDEDEEAEGNTDMNNDDLAENDEAESEEGI